MIVSIFSYFSKGIFRQVHRKIILENEGKHFVAFFSKVCDKVPLPAVPCRRQHYATRGSARGTALVAGSGTREVSAWEERTLAKELKSRTRLAKTKNTKFQVRHDMMEEY